MDLPWENRELCQLSHTGDLTRTSKDYSMLKTISNCTICCQDISENGGDMAHFTAVHKASIFSGGEPSQAMEEVTVPLAR